MVIQAHCLETCLYMTYYFYPFFSLFAMCVVATFGPSPHNNSGIIPKCSSHKSPNPLLRLEGD